MEERARYGLVSDLARATGLTPTSVRNWKVGLYRPEPDRWPAIERFFELPAGHLAAIELGGSRAGDVNSDVPHEWVSLAQHRELAERVDELTTLVQALVDQVRVLRGRRPGGDSVAS